MPLLGKDSYDNIDKALTVKSQWVYGTEMYKPSRNMRALQYVLDQGVVRVWNDKILAGQFDIGKSTDVIESQTGSVLQQKKLEDR